MTAQHWSIPSWLWAIAFEYVQCRSGAVNEWFGADWGKQGMECVFFAIFHKTSVAQKTKC